VTTQIRHLGEADRAPLGFAEMAVRAYAKGCEQRPVPG